MKNINRRKFISIFGLVSIGSITKISQDARSMEISVNRFENNQKVNLENIETVAFKMKEITITSNNIDHNKDAKLSVYASVEGQDLGKVKTIDNIDIKKSETNLNDDIIIKLGNSNLFSYDNYSNDKNNLDIELTFELEHTSIDTIKQTEKYSLDIGLSPGELISTDGFNIEGQYSDKQSKDSVISISSGELPVLDKSGIEQIKQLVQGPAVYDKSSTSIASGGIDPGNIRFDYSNFRDNPEISYNKPNSVIIDFA